MEPFFALMMFLFILFVIVIIMRLVGAWMLRINEVIDNQKELINAVDRLNSNLGNYFEKSDKENTNDFKTMSLRQLKIKLNSKVISQEQYDKACDQIKNL